MFFDVIIYFYCIFFDTIQINSNRYSTEYSIIDDSINGNCYRIFWKNLFKEKKNWFKFLGKKKGFEINWLKFHFIWIQKISSKVDTRTFYGMLLNSYTHQVYRLNHRSLIHLIISISFTLFFLVWLKKNLENHTLLIVQICENRMKETVHFDSSIKNLLS